MADNGAVPSHTFKFVLGFCGESVVPSIVTLPMLQFVREAFIHGKDLKNAFRHAWVNVEALKTTPVVLTYRDHDDVVKSEALTYSIPHVRMWGLTYGCGIKTCTALPGDVVSDSKGTNHDRAKFRCLRCRSTTKWIHRPAWIHPIIAHPYFFTHHYPLTMDEKNYVENSEWIGPVAEAGEWRANMDIT
jgi:hypothetical protein